MLESDLELQFHLVMLSKFAFGKIISNYITAFPGVTTGNRVRPCSVSFPKSINHIVTNSATSK
jgi:hypothetical protein